MKTAPASLPLAASLAARTPRPVSPEDALAVKNVANARMSPDGKLMLYELPDADLKVDGSATEIWIASAAAQSGARPRKFTSGREDRSPEWSPDGQWSPS